MPEESNSQYANVTLTDVHLASAYYPILIDLAKHKHCLTYGELVARAKQAYPDKQVVQKAIAVSTGHAWTWSVCSRTSEGYLIYRP